MTLLAYCTNVHAGADLPQTRQQLERHALQVKKRFSPGSPMGLGLWLAAAPARSLLNDETRLRDFSDWLGQTGLVPFTFNGFPYGNFHSPVVKHAVYEPTWENPARLHYTLDLIRILDRLLAPGVSGSISTLPLAWGMPELSTVQRRNCARHLAVVAETLGRLKDETGRHIDLAIEPEPGCAIQTAGGLIDFYQNDLLRTGPEQAIRRHIGVCHDVCHSAVMFENQRDVLNRYRAAGMRIGKVQISSAIRIDFDVLAPSQRAAAASQLKAFSEDRYLHQTCVRQTGESPVFFEDLPAALAASSPTGTWAIHFHVPVYLDRFELLTTSQSDIPQVLAGLGDNFSGHFEVETYAWGVLPQALKRPELADGIADELKWLEAQIHNRS